MSKITEKDIAKEIQAISGKYAPSEVFFDWVKCNAIAISNSLETNQEIRDKREDMYKTIMSKYEPEHRAKFCDMSGMLTMVMEDGMKDVLGNIYMDSGIYNKHLGQFFTPYSICRMMAEFTNPPEMEEGEYILVNEPSCGGGANIIAFAEMMKNRGINYQEHMVAVCQDLDWNVVYMCYVQMSLYGIPAIVVQGNTLTDPYVGTDGENVFYTPMYRINYLKFRKQKKTKTFAFDTKESDTGQLEMVF